MCCGIFCWHAYFDLLQESKNTLGLFKKYYGLSDSRKRELLFPDTWLIIDKVSRIIPEDAKIFLRTDNFCEMFNCAYGLFPRKIYLPEDSELHYLPPADNLGLNWAWLERKQISWVVVRTSDNVIRVMKIADGKILQETHFPG